MTSTSQSLASSVASAGGKGLAFQKRSGLGLSKLLPQTTKLRASFSRVSKSCDEKTDFGIFGLWTHFGSSEYLRILEVLNCKCTRDHSRSTLVAFAFALSPLSLATDRKLLPFQNAKLQQNTINNCCNSDANNVHKLLQDGLASGKKWHGMARPSEVEGQSSSKPSCHAELISRCAGSSIPGGICLAVLAYWAYGAPNAPEMSSLMAVITWIAGSAHIAIACYGC